MLLELVALSPVTICGSVIVVLSPSDVVVLPVMLVSLPPLVVVSFCTSLVVVVSPVSKIRVAIEPLAENVSAPVAFVLVVLPVPVALSVLLVLVVESDGGVYCAIAGARLNAAAKSPKTSTSAIAIDAFFIAKSVHKSILTILSVS
jgi:hypothetical protein